VKVRPRLLGVSLLIAAVVSVGLGWVIARSGADDSDAGSTVIIDGTDGPLQPPTLETNAVVKGDQLPDVSVQLLDGTDVSIASLAGQPMVINVWGSTCVPCKKELPDFAAAHLIYGDQVRFVGISFLPPSDREEAFARDRGVNYELLYDTNGDFINDVGIAAFPVTLFVSADGVIVRQTGQLDEESIKNFIESDLL
jgi:peroxiredoxin